ncbi:MAG: phosphate ABC transporter permease subunit PstC, partial [Alphaproteobacteria bacterium]|nr:phosphate ABC transporter permease subunit PstC [Alphaproteobacteria bacterium]
MAEAHPFSVGAEAITQPPAPREFLVDRTFVGLTCASALALVFLVAYILYQIGYQALPAIRDYHISFLWGRTWDAQKQTFGILPAIWGTLYSSLLALFIGGFFGITMAIFLTQDFLPRRIAVVFRTIVEMLAAIPSVVFGLWGIFVVIPAIRPIANALHEWLGFIPWFSTSLSGPGLLPAALVLAIMVLPTVAAISQDALQLVPYRTKEAAYGMGATRWEAILKVMLPTAAGGIFSALILGFGRALG